MRDSPAAAPHRPWPPVLWLALAGLVVAMGLLTWHQHAPLLLGPRLLTTTIRAALAGLGGILLLTWLEIQLESRAG